MSPASTLTDIPAIVRMATLGAGFGVWRNEVRDGKPTKVPYQTNGARAKSNDPTMWGPLAEALAAVGRLRADGLGVLLRQLPDGRWLVGVDLDLCISPTTREVEPWAQRIVDRFNTYCEVSPSSTGLKLFGLVRALPTVMTDGGKPKGLKVVPPGADVPEGAEGKGHDAAEIALFPGGRYFTVTGRHLEGTPLDLADITEAFAELAHEVAGMGRPNRRPVTVTVTVDLASLPERLRQEIEGDPKLAESWATGAKLGGGADTSASGLDFGLMAHLARRGRDDELIELAIRHYPHGQVGGGKLGGWNAERRIEGLLREAEAIRAKAQRFGEPPPWYGELVTTKSGAPCDCVANGALILRKDPVFVGRVLFDEHRGAVVCWDLPWSPDGDRRPWTGTDDVHFAEWCQVRGVPLKSGTCAEAVTVVADGNRMHPVREYLDGLEWDGVARLDSWLATYAGVVAGDAAYVLEVGRRWPISAVARVFRPGCKADAALILEGGQGAGKSSLLGALVPSPEWFADEIADLGSKDSAQDLSGKWIIELAELSALRRGEVERVKAFMSRAVDHYRPSYGRRTQDFPRQCVFAGTTNADTYLADETGNRRFWPVKVGRIDLDALKRDRDQLWAEAVAAFRADEKWWLDREIEKLAAEEQAERRIADPWEGQVLALAEGRAGKTYPGHVVDAPVTIDGLLNGLLVPTERQGQVEANRVARILRSNGWERYKARVGGGRVWAYRRPG